MQARNIQTSKEKYISLIKLNTALKGTVQTL